MAAMDFKAIDAATVIDTFLLLLIGIGPKIALVPFLDLTAGMDPATKARVSRKMITTASTVAVILVVFGGLLTRLLHVSHGALAVASGIILLIIAVSMVLKSEDPHSAHPAPAATDPMKLAVFPLAVPYLLNPAGIVLLVTISAETRSVGLAAIFIGLLLLVLLLDIVVFRWANRVSEQLDQSRMLVTEKVFGFLLAALAVQLVLTGLADVGVIHLTGH
jgi:small neutral amino acid transporter SnatA (MarC family)